jgi:hypothetical protein
LDNVSRSWRFGEESAREGGVIESAYRLISPSFGVDEVPFWRWRNGRVERMLFACVMVFEENCGLKGKKFKRWGDVR